MNVRMQKHHMAKWYAISLLCLAGCAEQRDPVNRIEAYAIPKSIFAGEWYYNQTVVDVPGSLTVTMPGNTNYNGTHRIRWDIQENYLYARKAYELVKGAKNADEDSGAYKGTIVGAWPIVTHFDIKRSYNPTTGEENNVLEENASDCKWFNCQYMRVDWSTNHATEFMFLDGDEDIQKESVPFTEQLPNDTKWQPIFDEKGGYIDFVNAMAIKPGKVSFGSVSYPLCWMFHGENAECNTEVIKIRNSFLRRHPNRDYEPRLHDGAESEWFGYFVNDRLTWNNHYGVTQKTRQKFINRHNIWVTHHDEKSTCVTNKDCANVKDSVCDTLTDFYTVDTWTDAEADGLPDSFETYLSTKAVNAPLSSGSLDSNANGLVDAYDDADKNGTADLYDYYVWAADKKVNRCTIPMEKRTPRPIAYFNTGDFPRELVCDKDDKGAGACAPWKWTADEKIREKNWSTLHYVANDYDEAWWRVFLRGGYGWSDADYQKWITTRDPNQFTAEQQKVLSQFGDAKQGYYAFTICANNPVQDSDPWPCRFNRATFADAKKHMDAGEDKAENRPYVRPGDIRFHQVHYIKDYYAGMGLLGLGPSHTDPRTGENIAGVANIYALNDWAATQVQEMVQLLNGAISPTQYVDGINLQNWINKLSVQSSNDEPTYDPSQIATIYDAMKQPWMSKVQKVGSPQLLSQLTNELGAPLSSAQKRSLMIKRLADSGMFDPAKFTGGLEQLKGSDLERQMAKDPDVMAAVGMPPASVGALTDDVLDKLSLARGGFLEANKAAEHYRLALSNRRSADFFDMADDSLLGLAHRLKKANPDAVWQIARETLLRAVINHELGHTFGLHHNWGGSEDVVNFHPQYWQLRTNNFKETKKCNAASPGADQLCPFFVRPMNSLQTGTDAQSDKGGLKGLYEYSYSTVMDYAGQYIFDGAGLGRYDKAALMYGHADKVEVFKNTHGLPAGVQGQSNIFNEWFSGDGSVLMFDNTGPKSFHYTNWFAAMGKDLYEESNRQLVDYHKVGSVPSADGEFYVENGKRMPRVPYVFCTYTKGDISDGCNTRDYGADQYERMKGLIDNWYTWYPMRSFTRYQYGYSLGSYIQRNYGRFYGRLKDFNNTYALYQALFRQWLPENMVESFFTDPINGYGAYTVAMQDAFNMALRTLAMPDIKQFDQLRERPDGQRIYSEAEFSVAFRTDLTNARYFTTSWNDSNFGRSCGLNWHECLHHFGFYVDKIMALFSMTDAQTYFVARDTAEDVRQWRIGFFNNFQTQLVDFFGAVLSQDYNAHAPWYDPQKPENKSIREKITKAGKSATVEWNNRIAYRNYAVPALDPPKPASGGAVEPATRFTMQLYMAVMGVLLFSDNFDNDFVERALLWKEGSSDGFSVKPTEHISGITSFEDPFSGNTYNAVAYKDGRGVTQRMVAYANRLKARTKYCNKTAGQPDSCSTQDARAETSLYDYRQLMDIMLKLTRYAKTNTNWSWDPFSP